MSDLPVLCSPLRTPIGRFGGGLAEVRPDDLAALVLRAVVDASGVDPSLLDEVVLGCANQAGEDNRNVARMATLLAGLPQSVPGVTVNRLCASGLEAVVHAARAVRCGEARVALAGGVESMSRAPFSLPRSPPKIGGYGGRAATGHAGRARVAGAVGEGAAREAGRAEDSLKRGGRDGRTAVCLGIVRRPRRQARTRARGNPVPRDAHGRPPESAETVRLDLHEAPPVPWGGG